MEAERDNFDEENVDLKEKIKTLKLQHSSELGEMKSKLTENDSETKYLKDRNAELTSKVQELQTTVKQHEETTADLERKLEKITSEDEVRGFYILSLEEKIKSNKEQFMYDINDMMKELRKKDLQLKSYEERVLPVLRSEFF